MNNSIQVVKGSLADIARQTGASIAEAFINADTIIVVDCSSSMVAEDATYKGTRCSRYRAACNHLAALQASLPGKLAIVAFNDATVLCPAGVPEEPVGSTDLAQALAFVFPSDELVQFILVSDGEPDNRKDALRIAMQFRSQIDTIFVGPEQGHGADFLRQLAKATGGQHATAANASDLAETTRKLLTAA